MMVLPALSCNNEHYNNPFYHDNDTVQYTYESFNFLSFQLVECVIQYEESYYVNISSVSVCHSGSDNSHEIVCNESFV